MPVVTPNFKNAMIASTGPTFMSSALTLEIPARMVIAKNPHIDPSEPMVVSIAFAISVFMEVLSGNIITFSIWFAKG